MQHIEITDDFKLKLINENKILEDKISKYYEEEEEEEGVGYKLIDDSIAFRAEREIYLMQERQHINNIFLQSSLDCKQAHIEDLYNKSRSREWSLEKVKEEVYMLINFN